MNVFVFYHITCLNNWKEIVQEQCTRIIFSGLYDIVTCIYSYAITIDREMVSEFLRQFGDKFVLQNTASTGDEWFTLQHIHSLVDDDACVLYLHTKGVTRYNTTQYTIHNQTFMINELYQNIVEWRDLMEYHLIKNYRECIKLLNDKTQHIDAVGVNYCTNPPHFSGNFWWAKGSYLKTLPSHIPNTEAWVLQNKGCFVSLYQSDFRGYGHYFYAFPLKKVHEKSNSKHELIIHG